METTATTKKKPAVKKTPVKKAAVKTTKKSDTAKKIESQLNVLSELSKIGDAYTEAINGKRKFSEVKEMFKKLHKQVKRSTKK